MCNTVQVDMKVVSADSHNNEAQNFGSDMKIKI